MSDYLLPEIVTDILSRLPVKPLLTFRCVCKSWNTLITSPRFIKIHLNQTKMKKLLLIRYMSSNNPNEHYSLRIDNAGFDEYSAFECPFKANRAYFRVVGVCNGLICLSDDRFGYICTHIIWNPAIRRFLNLPTPSVTFDSYGPYMSALGFGFDLRKDECKVVRLSYIQQREGDAMFSHTPKVEVYTVGSDSWRTIKKRGVPSCGVVDYAWTQAFLHGSVYWTGFKNDSKGGRRNVVLSFDMADEKFGIFEFPECHADTNPLHFSVGLFGDSLAFFVYNNPVNCASFAVYVMKEYGVVESWSKVLKIEMQMRTILGCREDGEVLVETRDNELASIEPNSKQTKNLGIRGYPGSLYAAGYEESLTLLNGLNGDLASQLKSYESLLASEDSSDEEDEVDEDYIEGNIAMQYVYAAASVPGFTLERPLA